MKNLNRKRRPPTERSSFYSKSKKSRLTEVNDAAETLLTISGLTRQTSRSLDEICAAETLSCLPVSILAKSDTKTYEPQEKTLPLEDQKMEQSSCITESFEGKQLLLVKGTQVYKL